MLRTEKETGFPTCLEPELSLLYIILLASWLDHTFKSPSNMSSGEGAELLQGIASVESWHTQYLAHCWVQVVSLYLSAVFILGQLSQYAPTTTLSLHNSISAFCIRKRHASRHHSSTPHFMSVPCQTLHFKCVNGGKGHTAYKVAEVEFGPHVIPTATAVTTACSHL